MWCTLVNERVVALCLQVRDTLTVRRTRLYWRLLEGFFSVLLGVVVWDRASALEYDVPLFKKGD